MPRRPRLRSLPPRLAVLPTSRASPPPRRGSQDPFYQSAAWAQLRAEVIMARGERCEAPDHPADRPRTGIRVFADHIVELKDGGAQLDPSNIMLMCGSCHRLKSSRAFAARQGRAAEPMADGPRGLPRPDWLLPAIVPLTLVCGPPAAGKSTWVRQHARPGELVLDLDEIIARLSGRPLHDWGMEWLDPGLHERNRLLAQLTRHPCRWSGGFLILTEPTSAGREWWIRQLRPARIVVLVTPEQTCLDRIAADPGRAPARANMANAVYQWFNKYQPRAGELVIEPVDAG